MALHGTPSTKSSWTFEVRSLRERDFKDGRWNGNAAARDASARRAERCMATRKWKQRAVERRKGGEDTEHDGGVYVFLIEISGEHHIF
jgi:hypothetical protein